MAKTPSFPGNQPGTPRFENPGPPDVHSPANQVPAGIFAAIATAALWLLPIVAAVVIFLAAVALIANQAF